MKNKRNVFQAFTMVIQFGLNMLVPILMCTLLGVWIGENYDNPPFSNGSAGGIPQYFYYGKKNLSG